MELDQAMEIVRAAGYKVTKPKAKSPQRPTLNAVGKPFNPNYDPNWKRRTQLTSIRRLSAPMEPASTLWARYQQALEQYRPNIEQGESK